MLVRKALLAASLVLGLGHSAYAGTIVSAVSGTIDIGAPGFGTLTETIDQTGLLTGYTSGVTDFDTYIAAGPIHIFPFLGNEWFSNDTSAQVTYDLGSILNIDKMALWNEDAAGIGTLDLLFSIDNLTFVSLLSGLAPTNNLLNNNYLPDVFSFATTSLRYIRLAMSGCPQAPDASFQSCSIGEVAFSSVGAEVPIPAALPLLGAALGALGVFGWRKKRGVASTA
jgi:hypothetical protein